MDNYVNRLIFTDTYYKMSEGTHDDQVGDFRLNRKM